MYIRKELYKVKKRFWNKLSVLCYHKVENTCADPVNITVGIRNFQKQIEWLKQSTNIITPKEFEEYKHMAIAKGFLMVASSPLTRSSYHASEDFKVMQDNRASKNN